MRLAEAINAARAYLDPKDVDCVVYHHPCVDGGTAALAGWLSRGDDIKYIPKDYSKPFDEEALRDKNVILIDTSFKPDEMERVSKIAKKIVVLDHHDTAEKNLHAQPGCFFVMENSGAVLGWHYFHGMHKPAPRFFQLVEDRDLWRWSDRANSEPLFYALMDKHEGLNNFTNYARYVDEESLEGLLRYGKELIDTNKKWCVGKARDAVLKRFAAPDGNDYLVMAIELENEKLYSELAEYIYTNNDVDMVMLWFKLKDGRFKLSFRNNKPEINVADIAAALGGGGHPRAAGATLESSPWGLLERHEPAPGHEKLKPLLVYGRVYLPLEGINSIITGP